jgi:hypothetical protein
MRNSLKNENGFVIISAILVLSLLTIIGISSMKMSITEVQISTNSLIHHMNFYAADSGAPVASIDLLDHDFLSESDYSDVDWIGTRTMNLGNGTQFTYEVNHQVDSDGNVLRYGDVNGDYLWEINTTHGRPLEIVTTHGTHIGRGGDAEVVVTLQFDPPFIPPEAALWVENPDTVNFKGNATVSGDSTDLDVCSDVPDVLHHIDPINPMDEPAHFGDEFIHESSGGMYPFGPVKDNLTKRADYIGDTFPTEIAEDSTIDNPVVIIIEGDLEINNEDLKVPAYGILYVDGNLRINGNVEWTGLIISTGNTSVGNGTADIIGSLITGESAEVDISGTITIQYDCSTLNDLYSKLSRYRMTSWRQI